MAAPGTLNLNVYQGDTAVYDLVLSRSTADGTELPVDLTGATGVAQIRKSPKDSTILASFTVSFPEPTAGKARMTLVPNETLKSGTWVWDVQITEADGTVKTWLAGSIVITPGVSR